MLQNRRPMTLGHGPARRQSWAGVLLGWAGATASMVVLWSERSRSRGALADLDDDLLQDVAITRTAARRESRKPFWVP
jgi:uncharacterized protein YjiS (DUF1127 family)